MIRRNALTLVVVTAAALPGCPPPAEDYSRCPEQYVSLESLLAEHNANAAKVPKLWARARIRVEFGGAAWGSASTLAAPNAHLLLSKADAPDEAPDFVLIGRETTVDVFRTGIDARAGLYYLWLKFGQRGRADFGQQKYAGAPGVASVPIDPAQLVQVLGVTELPPVAARQMPAVVLRMQGLPQPAYVVRYLKPQPVSGHLKVWREVSFRWAKDQPRRPFRVRLFDPAGLCRVVADLDAYQTIETDADGEPPLMPTHFVLTWPKIKGVQDAARLEMRLSAMSTTREFRPSVFDFWANLPPDIHDIQQVDQQYGRVEPKGTRP